jgi:histidinol dehydrogenase
MKLYKANQLTPEQLRTLCVRPWSGDGSVKSSVESICLDVKRRGDEALREYSRKFDAVALSAFKVTPEEVDGAGRNISTEVIAAIEHAARNIRLFHLMQLNKEEKVETDPGVICWRERRPLETVGLYIPAGSAPLPSTVLMLGIPALLANCSRIVLCSPPKSNGAIDPAVVTAANHLGIKNLYKAGGAQAIAAMAYGTQSIPKVEKIFGPGNQYVTEAKRLVSSDPDGAAIDLLAGPSELLIIADENAEPAIVAADLLSQAEHDPKSQVLLVSTNLSQATEALKQLKLQLETLPRKAIASQSIEHSFALVVSSLEDAARFSNAYAPEHLMINIGDAEKLLPQIQNAGSVFLGSFSPVTAGDYASGTNHTLPTGGTARWFSGVSVESFQKTVTFQSISRDGLNRLAPTLTTLAELEGLEGHSRAVRMRLESNRPKP